MRHYFPQTFSTQDFQSKIQVVGWPRTRTSRVRIVYCILQSFKLKQNINKYYKYKFKMNK